MSVKQIWVSDTMHKRLKLASVIGGLHMRDIVEAALDEYLPPLFSLPSTLEKTIAADARTNALHEQPAEYVVTDKPA